MKRQSARAFAPATVANVAVGFDVLGFPIDGVGDWVEVTRIAEPIVRIIRIGGQIEGSSGLPMDAEKNTATAGLVKLLDERKPGFGFEVSIEKGIHLGSGMGGSAASAVAAAVAANALLDPPLSREELLQFALQGELVASGAMHADNAAPCLFGGITLARASRDVEIVRIPVPAGVFCVVVHPHFRLDTLESRKALRREVALKDHVRQSANLGAFIAACFRSDVALLSRCMEDLIVEPQRARLIPAFDAVKAAAMAGGALGCSISGSGPSVFAWVTSEKQGAQIAGAMRDAFRKGGVSDADIWVSRINLDGAKVIA